MRGELSILTELLGINVKGRGINVNGRACRTYRKYRINKDNIMIIKETVKQKMQLKAQRLRKYEKSKFYRQKVRSFIEKLRKKL